MVQLALMCAKNEDGGAFNRLGTFSLGAIIESHKKVPLPDE
jgi:hypothetical protein